MNEYLSVKDVAALVRRNEETIRRMIRARKLDVELDNNNRRQGYMISVDQLTETWDISREEVDAYIEKRRAAEAAAPEEDKKIPLGPEKADECKEFAEKIAAEAARAGEMIENTLRSASQKIMTELNKLSKGENDMTQEDRENNGTPAPETEEKHENAASGMPDMGEINRRVGEFMDDAVKQIREGIDRIGKNIAAESGEEKPDLRTVGRHFREAFLAAVKPQNEKQPEAAAEAPADDTAENEAEPATVEPAEAEPVVFKPVMIRLTEALPVEKEEDDAAPEDVTEAQIVLDAEPAEEAEATEADAPEADAPEKRPSFRYSFENIFRPVKAKEPDPKEELARQMLHIPHTAEDVESNASYRLLEEARAAVAQQEAEAAAAAAAAEEAAAAAKAVAEEVAATGAALTEEVAAMEDVVAEAEPAAEAEPVAEADPVAEAESADNAEEIAALKKMLADLRESTARIEERLGKLGRN